MSLAENLLQVVVQGLIAGALPIYLFARSVILLGAGRAATFPALVPGFSLIIGYLALGVVPSIAQLVGLVIVVIGFQVCAEVAIVIPGRRAAPDPESRGDTECGSRIPGSRAALAPRNDRKLTPARHICPRSAGTCS